MSNIIMCDPKGGDPSALARALIGGTAESYVDETLTAIKMTMPPSLKEFKCHNVTTILSPLNPFKDTGVTALAFPNITSGPNISGVYKVGASLTAIDLNTEKLTQLVLASNTNMTVVVLRRDSSPVVLNNVSCFNSTPFASGGAGGTIYIPKALYDHLGDGTADDYKAATNWSTVDGYGTITWAKIEGSIYETKYADGTTIPT